MDPQDQPYQFFNLSKMGELMYFEQCPQSTTYFPLSQKLNNKGKRKH
jgi:hypothetical protein